MKSDKNLMSVPSPHGRSLARTLIREWPEGPDEGRPRGRNAQRTIALTRNRCAISTSPRGRGDTYKPHMSGFTLLELIVVIGIFALLSVMAYGGLNNVLKARQGVEQSLDRLADLQRAYWRLREDLQQIAPRPTRDEFGDARPAVWSELGEAVVLTRGGWRNPLGLPRSSRQRVSYELREEKLIRKQWWHLDQAPNIEPQELEVLAGVREMQWRFLGAGEDWQDSWPEGSNAGSADPTAPPPRAIEVTLDTRAWGELRLLFRTGLDLGNAAPPTVTP